MRRLRDDSCRQPTTFTCLGPVGRRASPCRFSGTRTSGLIPFDVDTQPDLVNTIHPLKLYEYLACGLPVVATSWSELRSLESPAVLCNTHADFVSGVREALSQPFDRAAAIDFARRADWGSRVETLLQELDLP